MEKFLIIGLGNNGNYYKNSRHNIGYKILDQIIKKYNLQAKYKNFGILYKKNLDNKSFIFFKPQTYMNIIGKNINTCMIYENISIKNILVVVDDLRLNLGVLKIKPQGGCGGHNGLKSIELNINSSSYPRLRFGIGNNFRKGNQINYVLSNWNKNELNIINKIIPRACEAIFSFGLNGIQITMNNFNNNK